jgi:pyruvate,orthophosphate dikinase
MPRALVTASQYCSFFDNYSVVDKNSLGGKGAGLVEMTKLGLPVPIGFTLHTTAWKKFRKGGGRLPEAIWVEVEHNLKLLEQKTGKTFGDKSNPLFVSVRSGAPVSMPGILETKLNLGINKATFPFLEKTLGKVSAGKIRHSFPKDFPENPIQQIRLSIIEVLNSWDTRKAGIYKERHGISETGTAITIQQMVWGNNLKEGAGTGVLLSRDTQRYSSGSMVTFAPHAQGPSVVDKKSFYAQVPLSEIPVPEEIRMELEKYAGVLEDNFKLAPQDIEFTYDGKALWILQTRAAPLSPLANLRSKLDRIEKKFLSEEQAIADMPSAHLNALIEPTLDTAKVEIAEHEGRLIGEGLSVSIGNKSGRIVTSLDAAREAKEGEIMVLADPNLETFAQLPPNVRVVLLEKAGVGSHLAREGTQLSSENNLIVVFGVRIDPKFEGKTITVDGSTGKVFEGVIERTSSDSQESLVSQKERGIAVIWLRAKRENPWKFVAESQNLESYEKEIEEALRKAEEQNIRSLKAREIMAFNAAVPAEIRQTYTVIKVDSFDKLVEKIRPILTKIFAGGHHATIRTCHVPAMPANGPWALVRNMENFEQFLIDDNYSPKYGGFHKFLENPDLTEILVGNIPVGKMEAIPEIQYKHCAWTLSCTENGTVILQVHPHNPHLREHEKAIREDLITYTTRFDPKSVNKLALVQREIGKNFLKDDLAINLGEISRHNIFDLWWTNYNLPQRMAAVTRVLGINATFEGQATEKWCLGYGIKTR